mgnify:FL=1
MYRLSYKNPETGTWSVVSTTESYSTILDMYSSIFWSAMERGLLPDPDVIFLKIEDLATGNKL